LRGYTTTYLEKDLGEHIKQMKKQDKYFNENLIITWFFQLVLAFQFMHGKKIVHRDIKPQNIFVDSDMNLKVGDFGVSKLLENKD
jgi:NIMA (never in mitosis gene a)-related kinase